MLERLQKILSARGIASRRKAEEYIEAGFVTVNGEVATLGRKADPEKDVIEVKGEVLIARQEMLYYLLHKPVGVITSNVDRDEKKKEKDARDAEEKADDDEPERGFEVTKAALDRLKQREAKRTAEHGVPTVRDILPKELQGKVFPVGRLDKDSSGLLLMTNDGVLAYRLTHPKFPHEKEYEVEVSERIGESSLRRMREGVSIDGRPTKPARVWRINDTTFRIAISEGRYRQIRRMCQKLGSTVTRLERVRIATIQDSGLKPGEIRLLTQKERDGLLKQALQDTEH